MATTYLIFENGEVIDTRDTKVRVYSLIPFLNDSAIIAALDTAEMTRDGSTPARDVTEDIVTEWVNTGDGREAIAAAIEAGRNAPSLALRFFPDECASLDARVNAEENYAEYRREMV